MPNCKLCGEPMPAGEEMFKYHGYSGNCPKPPLTRAAASQPVLQSLMIPDNPLPWPDPTAEMQTTPEFDAVWNCIKDWDISVPQAYGGYCGATGNHVRAILDALSAQKA